MRVVECNACLKFFTSLFQFFQLAHSNTVLQETTIYREFHKDKAANVTSERVSKYTMICNLLLALNKRKKEKKIDS